MIGAVAVYTPDGGRHAMASLDEVVARRRSTGEFVWVEMSDPSPEELTVVGRHFGIHRSVLDGMVEDHQRPRVQVDGDQLVAVVRPAPADGVVRPAPRSEILVVAGPGVVVVASHGPSPVVDRVRHRLDTSVDLVTAGPVGVLCELVDEVLDGYAPAMEEIDDEIAELETLVFSTTRVDPSERIYLLQRRVLVVHRAVTPLIEPLARVAGGRTEVVSEDARRSFRELEDHARRLHERTELDRELLAGILGANLTRVSVQQNDDMRTISAWAAMALVPTMIAGIYGMNFANMPELGWRFGYAGALVLMLAAAGALYANFRRRGWI
ncbi:MAG: magnesium and cobalt transport protein CorA [Acidimicrobiales bacterium]